MTTNEEFPPVIVRLSKYRTFRISVDTPPDYQPSVVLRRDTYDSKTGQLKTLAISVSMRSLSEFINALADVESFAVQKGWIEPPLNDDAGQGGAQ
jgi:hypothetical protein